MIKHLLHNITRSRLFQKGNNPLLIRKTYSGIQDVGKRASFSFPGSRTGILDFTLFGGIKTLFLESRSFIIPTM